MIWRADDTIESCEHVAIQDGDNMVCTHCGAMLATCGERYAGTMSPDDYAKSVLVLDDENVEEPLKWRTAWCFYDNDKSEFVNHTWTREGSGAVCTRCGQDVPEVEKYAPPDVIIDDQERGM